MKENYDKVFLVVVTVLAVGVAGYLVYRSLSFSDKFQAVETLRNDKLKPTGEDQVAAAMANLTTASKWEGMNLFVSIPVVETINNGVPALEEVGEGMIHPPVPNEWIQQYSPPHDITNVSVLTTDEDGDGFTLVEEYNVASPDRSTDPTNPEEFPPLITKLCLIEMVSSDYQLTFGAKVDATNFQINQTSERLGADSHFAPMNGTFAPDRDPSLKFSIVGYQEKSEPEPSTGGKRDVSELTISYTPPGGGDAATQVLTVGQPWELPTYTGKFRNKMVGEEMELKKGASFSLSNDPNTTFQILDVTPQGATLVGPDGSQIIVPPCL